MLILYILFAMNNAYLTVVSSSDEWMILIRTLIRCSRYMHRSPTCTRRFWPRMACCASSPTQAWTSPRWGVDFARLLEKLEITTHSALHIEQAADGMHGDHRSLDHPKGWTGGPEKHALGPYPAVLGADTPLVPQAGEAAGAGSR